MDIYTGYFAKMKKYKEAGLVPVSIAWGTPVWYEGETCFEVAPTYKILKGYKDGTISEQEYEKLYLQHLSSVDWTAVINKLYDISDKYDGKDLVLCCYEKSLDFCHRHILSDFLNNHGLKIEECEL